MRTIFARARYQSQRLQDWLNKTLEGRFQLTINREKTKVVMSLDLEAH
jgi:hypothetical protein